MDAAPHGVRPGAVDGQPQATGTLVVQFECRDALHRSIAAYHLAAAAGVGSGVRVVCTFVWLLPALGADMFMRHTLCFLYVFSTAHTVCVIE